MDRKGKQKLKRYFIVYVIFAVFFTVGMYLITKYEENAKATQIALLLAEHPELEGEIVAIWEKSGTVDFIRDRDDQKIERVVQMLEETYGYHSGSGSSDVVIRIIWGIGLLVGVIVCSLFLYLDRRKNWSRYGDEEQLQQLYDILPGNTDLNSPRYLTDAARKALLLVEQCVQSAALKHPDESEKI